MIGRVPSGATGELGADNICRITKPMSIRMRFGALAILSMMTVAAAGAFAADDPNSVVPAAAGSETVLHSFCSRANCTDGSAPATTLIADKAGNLYGTTQSGGTNDAGTVFKLVPGW